jgi:hypothetical protein
MTCLDIMQLLAEGKPLDAQAGAHSATCAECSALLTALNENLESPGAESITAITNRFVALKRVRPLPSNAVLVVVSLSIFIALSLVVASAVGFKAISLLTPAQIVLYYGTLLFLAVLYSRATVAQMIPGSKRVLPPYLLSLLAIGALGPLLFTLFQDRSTANFVAEGIPCLTLGALSALLSGLLAWRLLHKGYLVSPREAITLYGFFSGLVGVAVLALHCGVLTSWHILVWHIGAMLIAGFAGLLLGSLLERSSHAD